MILTLFLLLGKKSQNTSAEWNEIIAHVEGNAFQLIEKIAADIADVVAPAAQAEVSVEVGVEAIAPLGVL